MGLLSGISKIVSPKTKPAFLSFGETEAVTRDSFQKYLSKLQNLAANPQMDVTKVDKTKLQSAFVNGQYQYDVGLLGAPAGDKTDVTRMSESSILEQYLPYAKARIEAINTGRTQAGRSSTLLGGAGL